MKSILHERPGVYSSYDASAVVRGGRAARTIGVADKYAAEYAAKRRSLRSAKTNATETVEAKED